MGKLIYAANISLDGFLEDETGSFDWSAPDEDVHAFWNEHERHIGTSLYGRRMYETMRVWESDDWLTNEPPVVREYAGIWRDADKVVYSTSLTDVSTARTRIERQFEPEAVRRIQGASQDYPNKAEALVRNVDLLIFGSQVARSTVDFDRLDDNEVESIRKGIFDTKTVKAHYVHLAEGQKTNQTSVNEYLKFTASTLFSEATVMIHGTALSRTHFDQLAAVGGKLVWSPQSNLRLYNETTDIGAALAAGVPVALGADWMPSGSPSLLHEMKVAWQVIAQSALPVTPPDLVRMVTSGAAEIAGLADKIGTLQVGRAADLTILQKRMDDPYENVVSAYPSWVEMVIIGGDIIYGRPDWVGALSIPADYEQVTAWGRPMLLDTRFGSLDDAGIDGPPRRLAQMRAKLIARYPAVGPIFA
jgi:5-methylthioadenosine/S-adenosylhomocysteine deaminase